MAMAEDILPGLLSRVKRELNHRISQSKKLKASKTALSNKTASYTDANEYALELGDILADVLVSTVTPRDLPDGKMYFNIADRLLRDVLHENYREISAYSTATQKLLNEKARIHLRVQSPKFNEDRVKGIINRISSEDDFSQVGWLLGAPIVNFSQSVVDDTIDENAKFQSRSGLRPLITRRLSGRGCEWCRNLAGTYEYLEAPADIYRRHDRCRCTVEYLPGSGKRQNVWTKKWNRSDKDAKVEARKKIGVRDLTNAERAAINQYISSESYKLNDMLRSGVPLPKQYQTLNDNLLSALDKLPRYEGTINRSLTSWGGKDFMNFINAHQPGTIWQYNQFMSFSTGVYSHDDDARVIVQHSHAAADLRRFNSQEQEVLYKPDQKFRVADSYLLRGKPTIILEEFEDE